MAHVRHIRTDGFPDAGTEEEGYYSVVISSRTGQVKNLTTPTPQVVHLVSLEHYDSTLNTSDSPFNSFNDSDRIGLVSLHSWIYTCIPEAANFVDVMENLAAHMQPLRPPQPVLDAMKTSSEEP